MEYIDAIEKLGIGEIYRPKKASHLYFVRFEKGYVAGNFRSGEKEFIRLGSHYEPKPRTEAPASPFEPQPLQDIIDCAEYVKYHPYTEYKRIKKVSVLVKNNTLLIPIRDHNKNLKGVQYIFEQAPGVFKKMFCKGSRPKGAFNLVLQNCHSPRLWVSEGWATAATLVECDIKDTVVAAMSLHNLEPVIESLKSEYEEIILLADNDMTNPANPGLTETFRLSAKHNVRVTYPTFPHLQPGADFSDLYLQCGKNVTLHQLMENMF